MTQREYEDDEVREIFSLATTGGTRDRLPAESGGMTLEQLQRIGQEAGIEPARLVSECRTTFGVKGKVMSSGGLREWSHGNLHICVEPTEHGEQLRLSTLNQDAIALNGLGVALGVMSVLFSSVVAASGKPEKALLIFGMFGGLSLAAFGANVFRLPRWARERERQMAAIAERAVKLFSNSDSGAST